MSTLIILWIISEIEEFEIQTYGFQYTLYSLLDFVDNIVNLSFLQKALDFPKIQPNFDNLIRMHCLIVYMTCTLSSKKHYIYFSVFLSTSMCCSTFFSIICYHFSSIPITMKKAKNEKPEFAPECVAGRRTTPIKTHHLCHKWTCGLPWIQIPEFAPKCAAGRRTTYFKPHH